MKLFAIFIICLLIFKQGRAADTVINKYAQVLSISSPTSITVNSASDFASCDLVLVMQMNGAVVDSSNSINFGDILTYQNAGNYELNAVSTVTGNTITLSTPLQQQYSPLLYKVQLIKVPVFQNYLLAQKHSALAWNGLTGGVFAMAVKGSLYLNDTIDVKGKGFRPSALNQSTQFGCNKLDYFYPGTSNDAAAKGEGIAAVSIAKAWGRGKLANAGGGGNDHNSGGGGGSNAGSGGNGGNQYPLSSCNPIIFPIGGVGGSAVVNTNLNAKLFMGGAGGNGHGNDLGEQKGGFGGGIVLLFCDSIVSSGGVILAGGSHGIQCQSPGAGCQDDGTGGGGGGGSVLLLSNHIAGNLFADASGGKGANAFMSSTSNPALKVGPGGGGGGGIIGVMQTNFPANVTTDVLGGQSGILPQFANDNYGAQAGSSGQLVTGLSLPSQIALDSIADFTDSLVCSSAYFTYTGIVLPGMTYLWDFGDGNVSSQMNPVHTYNNGTNYTVKLLISLGCLLDSVHGVISIAAPLANAGPNQLVNCINDTVTLGLGANPLYTYSWSPGITLLDSTLALVQAFPLTTTQYILTVTDTSGCTAKDTVLVSANFTTPFISAGPDKTLLCFSPATLIGSASLPNTTFSWSPAQGLSNANIAQTLASPTSTTSYVLTATNNISGCSASDTVVVNVNNTPPVLTAGPNQTINCNNPTVTLGSNPSPSTTYTWTSSAWLSDTTIANPIANPPVSTTYTVVATNLNNNCTATDTVLVNVSVLSVNAGPSASVNCANPGVQIGTLPLANFLYSWSPTNGLSSVNTAQTIASPTVNTVYTLTLTNPVDNCTATDTVSVFAFLSPPLANAGVDDSLNCLDSSVQIGSAAVAQYSYSWQPLSGLSNANVAQPTAAPLVSINYTLTVTDNSNNCTSTDVVTLFVDKVAPPVNAGLDSTIDCTKDSVFIGSSTFGPYNYQWSPFSGLQNPLLSGSKTSPSITTVYTLQVTDPDNFCSSYDQVIVTVNKILPNVDAGADVFFCQNTPAQLQASPGYTYLWQPSAGLSANNISNPLASPSQGTTYTVHFTDAFNCTGTDSVRVNIASPPQIVIDSFFSLCQGDSILVQAQTNLLYNWSPAISGSVVDSVSFLAYPAISTIYTISGTDAQQCTNSATFLVQVNALPTFTVLGDGLYCAGDTAKMTIAGGDSYTWLPQPTNINLSGDSAMFVVDTTIQFNITAINNNACRSSQNILINAQELPKLLLQKSNDIDCGLPYSSLVATGADSYIWLPAALFTNPVQSFQVVQPSTATVYTVVGNSNGCIDSAQIQVNVFNERPNEAFIPNAFSPNHDGKNDCLKVLSPNFISSYRLQIYNRWGQQVFESKNEEDCWDGSFRNKPQEAGVYFYYLKAKTNCGDIEKKGEINLVR